MFKSPSLYFLRLCLLCLLMMFVGNSTVYANNFASPSRGGSLSGQNALGFGYYSEPVLYEYTDTTKDSYLSRYSGFLLQYSRYFGPTSALNIHYMQASGEEDLRALSGSLVYGMNLNLPGFGAYIGVSYTLKQRTQFVGDSRVSNEKEYGWDYPIGVKIQNGLFTFNIETRYKHFVLQGKGVEAKSQRYPLYLTVLMPF